VKSNGALLVIALGIGAQIPTSIASVSDPAIRSLLQLLAVLVCVFVSVKIDPTKGVLSVRPPPISKD
jgi:hypothetical protein